VQPVVDLSLVDALNSFVASAITTLRDTMHLDATLDCTSSPNAPAPRLVVAVDISGDLRCVTWVFPIELARELARQMVGEVNPELAGYAAVELANILTGRAIEPFHSHGLHIEIHPPQLVAAFEPGMRARLVTALGSIEIVFYPVTARPRNPSA
jgi:CheY-specific phosphatase CheX